jgi:RNA polymerase sigma-70 factor (ECF subfamily)
LYLSTLFQSGTLAGLSDGELLDRFASARGKNDETAELAFATLMARHGPMVWRVCRAVLGDRHKAEDAFQAAFLVLATRARSIRRSGSIGSWLYGVALRVAACARSRAARRQRHERRRAEMTTRMTQGEGERPEADDDSDRVIHEEIGRLPERFRSAVVLCYLEGLTHEMAASQLGCPVGTIRSRLATARERLRQRLTRRGVAPAAIPAALSGPPQSSVTELPAPSMPVPVATVDATLRGALRIGLGQTTLAGVVSAEAVVLMKGDLMTMTMTKLAALATTVLAAGLVTAGAGVAAHSALRQVDGPGILPASTQAAVQEPSQKPATSPPAPQLPAAAPARPSDAEVKEKIRRRSEENVRKLLRDYDSESTASRKAIQNAKTKEERQALAAQRRPDPASYAGALLFEAEMNPGTPQAEEALIWIVSHLDFGSMLETAKEMIVRDHIQSDKLDGLVSERLAVTSQSKATERLLRETLAKNPHVKIRAQACYALARYLDVLGGSARLAKLAPASYENPIAAARRGISGQELLSNVDPDVVEREAATLYERVVKEFGDQPIFVPAGVRLTPGRPTTYGGEAQGYLHELRDLGIGKPAPEIDGVDLDGKPMKLSDYRGRVVAIYFCSPIQLRSPSGRQATVTEEIRGVALRHANDAFALLGVTTTVGLPPQPDRDRWKELLKTSGLPARFWWDSGQNNQPGPIQTAWNTRLALHVLDHRGVIRYKHMLLADALEKALTTLLKEQKDELARSKKAE